jgi:hypothetical protein
MTAGTSENPPSQKDVDFYLDAAVFAAGCADSPDLLRRFWKEQEPNRRLLGIAEGTPGYRRFVDACAARVAALEAASLDPNLFNELTGAVSPFARR